MQWIDRLKYIGRPITVCSGKKCEIDISVSLPKAYSAANSILSKTKYVSEIVRFNLSESYVFPVLFYALDAVTLSLSEQRQFAICLNNLYRRIFGMARLPVSQLGLSSKSTGIGRHQRVVQWSNVVHGATDVYFSFINGLLLRVGFLQSLNIIDSRVALGGNAVGLVHECSRSDFYDRPSQCSLGLTFTI